MKKEKIQDWYYYTIEKPLTRWWYWFKHNWHVRMHYNFMYMPTQDDPSVFKAVVNKITIRKECLWYDLSMDGVSGDFADEFVHT